jgi:hypothetical protein
MYGIIVICISLARPDCREACTIWRRPLTSTGVLRAESRVWSEARASSVSPRPARHCRQFGTIPAVLRQTRLDQSQIMRTRFSVSYSMVQSHKIDRAPLRHLFRNTYVSRCSHVTCSRHQASRAAPRRTEVVLQSKRLVRAGQASGPILKEGSSPTPQSDSHQALYSLL